MEHASHCCAPAPMLHHGRARIARLASAWRERWRGTSGATQTSTGLRSQALTSRDGWREFPPRNARLAGSQSRRPAARAAAGGAVAPPWRAAGRRQSRLGERRPAGGIRQRGRTAGCALERLLRARLRGAGGDDRRITGGRPPRLPPQEPCDHPRGRADRRGRGLACAAEVQHSARRRNAAVCPGDAQRGSRGAASRQHPAQAHRRPLVSTQAIAGGPVVPVRRRHLPSCVCAFHARSRIRRGTHPHRRKPA
jgi:hypothetical protein